MSPVANRDYSVGHGTIWSAIHRHATSNSIGFLQKFEFACECIGARLSTCLELLVRRYIQWPHAWESAMWVVCSSSVCSVSIVNATNRNVLPLFALYQLSMSQIGMFFLLSMSQIGSSVHGKVLHPNLSEPLCVRHTKVGWFSVCFLCCKPTTLPVFVKQ